jgi:uncharacterized protein
MSEFVHDAAAHRHTMLVGGEAVSFLEYADHGSSFVITRVVTVPQHRGRGLAARLVEHVVDEVSADGRPITPVCSFAVDWFDRHPERAGLLAG